MSSTTEGLPPKDRLPRHVAIIMDGNGRWAKRRGWMRIRGHERGADVVREVTEECARIGIERLTLYAFSAENWKRPEREVALLMKLLRKFLVDERPTILKNNIRFTAIGRLEMLPDEVMGDLRETIGASATNTGMVLCLALSYGGRSEILDAGRKVAAEASRGALNPATLTEDSFRAYLYDPGMPDPDLLIRTGGDVRISNFLLWQISYAEIWVTPVMWPEFSGEHLHAALRDYAARERRFGDVRE